MDCFDYALLDFLFGAMVYRLRHLLIGQILNSPWPHRGQGALAAFELRTPGLCQAILWFLAGPAVRSLEGSQCRACKETRWPSEGKQLLGRNSSIFRSAAGPTLVTRCSQSCRSPPVAITWVKCKPVTGCIVKI